MARNGRAVSSRSLHKRVDVGRTHDGAAAHEGLVVVLDVVVVVKIIDHDTEGFLDRTELGVA
jgi:hypothetical protein